MVPFILINDLDLWRLDLCKLMVVLFVLSTNRSTCSSFKLLLLQVHEFEKTIQLLEDLNAAIEDLLAELDKLAGKDTPINKLIDAEHAFQAVVAKDQELLLSDVESHCAVYNTFTQPYIQRSRGIIRSAIQDLLELQSEHIRAETRNESSLMLFNGTVKQVIQSLQKATGEVQHILHWPDYVNLLMDKHGIELNTRFWSDSGCTVQTHPPSLYPLDHLPGLVQATIDTLGRINESQIAGQ